MMRLLVVFLATAFACTHHTESKKVQTIRALNLDQVDSIRLVCMTANCDQFYKKPIIIYEPREVDRIVQAINKSRYYDMSSERTYTKYIYETKLFLKEKEDQDVIIQVSKNKGSYIEIFGDGFFAEYLGDYRNDSLEFIVQDIYNDRRTSLKLDSIR